MLFFLQSFLNGSSLCVLVTFHFFDERFQNSISLRANFYMIDLYFIFLEEILQNVLSTIRIVKGSIAFEKCSYSFFVEMSACDFFFGKLLNALNNFLVCHFKDDKFSWSQPFF